MTIVQVLDQERELEALEADYEAARPYIERLKKCYMSMRSVATMQTASPANSHQDRDMWTGQGVGIDRCAVMLEQHYYDDRMRLEHECAVARARIDAEGRENMPAGKPVSGSSAESDIFEDDDD